MGKKVAIERCVAAKAGIRQVDIRQTATAQLVDFMQVVLNPRPVAQRRFSFNRHHGHGTRAFAVGRRANFEHGGFVRCAFKQLKDFVRPAQLAAVDRQQVIAFLDVYTGLR